MFKPPANKPPPDFRDDEEKAEVARILSVLPAEHPARVAFAQGRDTIALTHLVGDAELTAKALTKAFLAGANRIMNRGHFKP